MKKYWKYGSSIALMASFALTAHGAIKSMPVTVINGQGYYVYECRKGDTLFGIARDNNWDDATLQRLNPDALGALKKGVKLFYPVDEPGQEMASVGNVPLLRHVAELSHKVEKGENVYSIASLYNVPVSTLYRLNPSSRSGVTPGETLIIRKAEDISGNNAANPGECYYTFTTFDNLGELAKSNNTTVAEIFYQNPGINPASLKPGTVLKMPANGAGIVKVKKIIQVPVIDQFELYSVKNGDTWESIAGDRQITVEDLKAANHGIKTIKKNSVISVPKIVTVTEEKIVDDRDERENSEKGRIQIYNEAHRINQTGEARSVSVAIVAENPAVNKDADFVRGFLSGVNLLKDKNFKIKLKVIDGSKDSHSITEGLDVFQPDIVFFTGDKNMPDYLREYAMRRHTLLVNTFDVRNENYLDNPYLLQLLAPPALFNESIASNAFKKFGNRRLVVIGAVDEADQLAPELLKLWKSDRITYLPEGITDKQAFADADGYLFYSYYVRKDEVEKTLKEISEVKEISPFADIAVMARPNWIVYDSSLGEAMHRVNTYIPSRFYMDGESREAREFMSSFKSLFNRTPIKSLPLYAAVGYDVATYFIPELAEANNDINLISPSSGTVQSAFDLKRVSNWGGFINPPVYFVNFTTFDTIDKIVVE